MPSEATRADAGAVGPPNAPRGDSPLAYRDFRLLWIGQFVSQVGNQMQVVAVAWQVYQLSHDPLALGAIGLVRVLPIIVLGIFGGVIADAIDRRRLMLATQTILMLISFALFALTRAGAISVGGLYACCLLAGAAIAVDNPARQAIVPSLVPDPVLPRALSLGVTTWQLATVLGPMFGGLLLAARGAEIVYLLDALSFLAVLYALLVMRHRAARASGVRLGMPAIREGFRFLRGAPILLSLMLLDFLATFFAGAMLLMPIFANDLLAVGPRGLGALFAAPAIGSMLAALVISTTGPPPLAGSTVLWCIALYGGSVAAFRVSGSFLVAIFFLTLSGAADGVSTVVRQTLRQLLTPDELRGRMTAVNMIFFMGGPQLGEFEAGAVARLCGARCSVVSGGVLCVLLGAAFTLLAPRLRRYRLEPGA